MNTGAVAKRYAKAFFELTQESGRGEQVYAQAQSILHRDVPAQLEPDLEKLMLLLRKNGRLDIAMHVIASFCAIYRQNKHIVQATLHIAAPAPGLEDRLRQLLAEEYGGDISFTEHISPELIGGFVLEVDDRILDASVKTQLDKIRKHFEVLNKRLV